MRAGRDKKGRWRIEAPCCAAAGRHMDGRRQKPILPFLRPEASGIDRAVAVDPAVGRGRAAARPLPLAGRLHVVDPRPDDAGACRRRFGGGPRVFCRVTDGRSLPLPDAEPTFLFRFGATLRFDSDAVRAYLRVGWAVDGGPIDRFSPARRVLTPARRRRCRRPPRVPCR